MSSSENIAAAFSVVLKTYESIYNLFVFLQSETAKRGEFEMMQAANKFLRWNSDTDFRAWAYDDFIHLFQNKSDNELENGWHDGPIYVLEINLKGDCDAPQVILSRFDYEDIASWSKGCSVSNHYIFYDPLYKQGLASFNDDNISFSSITINDRSGRYWGLKKIRGLYIPLVEITSENAYEKIIGGFKSLSDMK